MSEKEQERADDNSDHWLVEKAVKTFVKKTSKLFASNYTWPLANKFRAKTSPNVVQKVFSCSVRWLTSIANISRCLNELMGLGLGLGLD